MAPARDAGQADPGLASERTELAWTRTAISFAALGAAMLKSQPVPGSVVLAFAAAIWELGRLPRSPRTALGRSRRLLLITLTVTGIAIAALVLSYAGSRAGLPVPRGADGHR